MSIIQMPTSNFWANRYGNKPRWIILHGTAGGSSPQGVAQGFIQSQGTSDPKSVHYVIGQDGSIVQCVQEKDAAWGNGVPEKGCDPWWSSNLNPNLITISIEHVKPDTTNGIPLTAAQAQASFALVRDICDRWGIPKRKADKNGGITGHFSISPVDRARCPGTYPWNDLFEFLGDNTNDMLQITDPFAATFFKQTDNDHWYCPNTKQTIAFGILNFYRKIQGAPRLPLTGECYDIPDVAYQVFESGVIVYDPKQKLDTAGTCYMLKNTSDLAKRLSGLTDALAQIQAEQAKEVALQAELDNLKSPVDKAAISADIVSAQTALQSVMDKLR